MNIKLLLEVEIDDEEIEKFGPNPSKKVIAEDIAGRLMLNEIARGDFRMLKEVYGRLVPYGEPF